MIFQISFLYKSEQGHKEVGVNLTDGSGNTATDRYTVSVSSASQTVSQYQYDADGNLADDGERIHAWDALCRLLSIEEKGTAQGKKKLEFVYNGLHQRVKITAKNWVDNAWVADTAKSNVFVWDNTKIAQKRSIDGAALVRNYYEKGFTEGSTKYFYTKDHLGSIREVVGNDGATVHARIDYDAWGNITSETNGAGNAATVFSDFSYTGHFRHAYAPHLVFAMYRAYAPDLGRWISRDPIEETDDTNIYKYVKNIPILKVDHSGLFSCEEICNAVKNAYKGRDLNWEMLNTGKTLDEVGGYVAGRAQMGGDDPVLDSFEKSWYYSIRGVSQRLLVSFATMYAIYYNYKVYEITPPKRPIIGPLSEALRSQDYIEYTEDLARKNGCDCNSCY